jgi:hypothetical protein
MTPTKSARVSIDPRHQVTPQDIKYLTDRMRACDVHEFVSVGGDVKRDSDRIFQFAWDDSYLARLDGEPVFYFGSCATLPHVRQLFGFGTEKTPRVIPAVTRFGNTVWKPRAFDAQHGLGATRIEVRVPVSCTHSFNWLQHGLGGRVEATLKGLSLFGEDYVQLAYTKDDYDNVHLRRTRPAANPATNTDAHVNGGPAVS